MTTTQYQNLKKLTARLAAANADVSFLRECHNHHPQNGGECGIEAAVRNVEFIRAEVKAAWAAAQ